MTLAVAALSLALAIGSAADVTGRWEGKITAQRPDGTPIEDTALLILEQKGSTLSGTIGGSDADQHPITSGTVDGDKITIQARHAKNDRTFKLELTLDGDQMKGTMTSGERTGQIVVKRVKP
jgi:hypothetical protein